MLGSAQGPPDGTENTGQHHVLGQVAEARGTETQGWETYLGSRWRNVCVREEAERSPRKTPGSLHPSTSCSTKELLLLLLPLPHPHSWPIPPLWSVEAKVCVLGLINTIQVTASSRCPAWGTVKRRFCTYRSKGQLRA